MVSIDLSLAEGEALLSACVRHKFYEDERPEPYFGSPYLAAVLLRVLDAVIRECDAVGEGGRAESWRAWGDWSERAFEQDLVVAHAAAARSWDQWDDELRVQFLRSCAAPFEVDDAAAHVMVDEVNRRRSNM